MAIQNNRLSEVVRENVFSQFTNKTSVRMENDNSQFDPSKKCSSIAGKSIVVTARIPFKWWAAIGPLAAVTSSGMTAGYSTVLLPQLQEKDTSTAVLSMAVGCVLSGPLMDRLGRKLTHQITSIPFAAGWFLLAGSSSIWMLYTGRFLTGLCVGLISPVSTVYIAETAGPEVRGPLLAAVSFCVALGVLLVHLLGTFISWARVAAISALLPIICLLCVSIVPETPTWLQSIGRSRQAQASHAWFHGDGARSDAEPQKTDESPSSGVFWKPFLVMCLFFTVQQCSGVNAVTFYTVHLLRRVGLHMDKYVATLVLDAVRLFFSTAACYLLKLLNRRTLALVSGVGSGVSLIGLSLVCSQPDWLPVPLLGLYIAFESIGLVPLPWIMVGEVFPVSTRGLGSGLASCYGFLVFFTVVKTSPGMLSLLGAGWTFAAYGLIALLGTLLLLVWLPETRNKTLEEIEEQLRK
ncbi:hypothetical protein C0J52_05091 [Blattella germanica]|nr:hypothetical protein C0J52_05091 [Blattella germanica]